MKVEIIGTDGKVHYTRPHDHPDVLEALNTPGYSVRGTGEKQSSSASLLSDILYLRNEIDCRIDHGASGVGHLEYVRNCLDQIVGAHRPATCADSTYKSEEATLDAIYELERALWAAKEKKMYGNAEIYAGQARMAFVRARNFRELGTQNEKSKP